MVHAAGDGTILSDIDLTFASLGVEFHTSN